MRVQKVTTQTMTSSPVHPHRHWLVHQYTSTPVHQFTQSHHFAYSRQRQRSHRCHGQSV